MPPECIFTQLYYLGMDWYKKCVDRAGANAKPFRFQDCVLVYPNQRWMFPANENVKKSQNAQKYGIKECKFSDL